MRIPFTQQVQILTGQIIGQSIQLDDLRRLTISPDQKHRIVSDISESYTQTLNQLNEAFADVIETMPLHVCGDGPIPEPDC